MPQYDGIILPQKNSSNYNQISIHRDEFGIPHIKSKSFKDTIYGLGWTHSQDRLWSMHLKRRLANGRLSEFAGPQAVETDKFFRSVSIRRIAEQQAKNLKEDVREIIQAYCDGINDQVASKRVLPLEFLLTGEKFEDWTIADTYSMEVMTNLFLSLDFMFEPFKDYVKNIYGVKFANQAFSAKSEFLFDNVTILDDDDLKQSGIYHEYHKNYSQQKIEEVLEQNIVPTYIFENFVKMTQIEALENSNNGFLGSNDWVVSGNFTKHGKPILANDPHLDLLIPSFWYQCELIYQDSETQQEQFVIGASAPGIPLISIGRNNYAAWGITNNMADTSDLYLEKFDGKGNYLHDGKWIKMQEFEEIIHVKGQSEPIKFTTHRTHHGVVLDSLFDFCNQMNPFKEQKGLSLGWVGIQNEDRSINAIFGVMQAKTVDEIHNNLANYNGPVLNFIYGTVDNHIGYLNIGNLPVKNHPENIFIMDGTKLENDWVRFYNKSENPFVKDPKKGYIVTANNKIATDNLVNHVCVNSITHARSHKITELLKKQIEQKQKFSVKEFQDMQQITIDSYCEKAKPFLLKIFDSYQASYLASHNFSQQNITEKSYKLNLLKQQLVSWPCEMSGSGHNSIGASIFGVWEQKFLVKLMRNATNNHYINNRIVMNFWFDQFFFNNIVDWGSSQENIDKFFCKNTQNQHSQMSCVYNVFLAFEETYDLLVDRFGDNIKKWQWGKIVDHSFLHSPFSSTPLKSIFQIDRPGYGNKRTINVGGSNYVENKWRNIYSSNFRIVMSLDDSEKSYYIIDTGISENRFSRHYQDQLDMFIRGEYIEMKWGSENLHLCKNLLVLNPKNSNAPNSKDKNKNDL